MQGKLMVSPVGFTKWKVVEAAKRAAPTRVILIHTDHEHALKAAAESKDDLEAIEISVEDWQVKDAFDFVEWYETVNRAIDMAGDDEVIVNLTPSHGVALSMAAMVAAMRSLPAVCYDKYGTGLHHVSPSIIFHLADLEVTDKKLLQKIAIGEVTVTEAGRKAGISEISTVSFSLKRLHERGFLDRKKVGRNVYYSLRPGVREFLRSIIGPPSD